MDKNWKVRKENKKENIYVVDINLIGSARANLWLEMDEILWVDSGWIDVWFGKKNEKKSRADDACTENWWNGKDGECKGDRGQRTKK